MLRVTSRLFFFFLSNWHQGLYSRKFLCQEMIKAQKKTMVAKVNKALCLWT